MIQLGKKNTLRIKHIEPFLMIVLDETGKEITVSDFPENIYSEGNSIQVFVYRDKSGELVGTLKTPKAQVGEFALLKVTDVNKYGAFLDWGLEKELFVPFREQKEPMIKGESYLVYIKVDDKSDRIIASSKIRKYLDEEPVGLNKGDKVQLIIESKTDLGYNAIINHRYIGLCYDNEIFQPLEIGQKLEGYIKSVRSDGKIDLSLTPIGFSRMEVEKEKIWNVLKESNGYLPLHDKSDPDEIKKTLGMSKKTFKAAIGMLYKEGKIIINSDGITINNASD